jgi:RNA polymerase sigma factor (sigma-70 family)
MASKAAHLLAKHLGNPSSAARVDGLPDGELLQRFAAGRDEDAFAALVRRHGPMVLRVCRRVLHNGHDAEDVFQATFFVLSRKAGSLHRRESVGCFLHGVAYRLALKARTQFARPRIHEGRATVEKSVADPRAERTVREARAILDEELARLPEKYRAPLVLCCLEGKTRDEAARLLGWLAKLVKSRLDQGRERLRSHLSRRGLTLPAALLAEEAAPAALPAALMRATVKAVVASPGNGIAPSVAVLAESALRGVGGVKAKVVVGLLLLTGILPAGTRIVAPPPVAEAPGSPAAKHAETPRAAKTPEPAKSEKQRATRTDHYGDALPAGARARIGTKRFRHGNTVFSVCYSPDGKTLASVGGDGVRLWDAATGKERHSYDRRPIYNGGFFSPDGRRLWLQSLGLWQNSPGEVIYYWNLKPVPEREPRKAPFEGSNLRLLAASPDGKSVAIGEKNLVRLCDAASGKESRQFKGHQRGVIRARYSADGKILASFDGESIILWNVKSGEETRSFRAANRRNSFMNFALSPDGKMLVSGGDSTVLVWNMDEVLPAKKRRTPPLAADDLNTLWGDLKADDATQAYRAIWKLADAPDQAISFLRQRLRPAHEPDKNNAERIVQLIGDLDKDAFAVREKASRELATFGREAEPALRKALASGPSAESKRRIEDLLRKLPESLPSPAPEQLRQLRALAVLEYAATPEAKKCLETLAGGSTEARLTREAKAALERLAHQPH